MHLQEVEHALAVVYGRHSVQWRPTDPLRKLIARVLGGRTTHAHVERAMHQLSSACRDWADVAALPHDLLAELIRPVGMAQPKAARIHGILTYLYQEAGRYSLDHIRAMDTSTATRYLLNLPGVGDHTAALVLVFALGRPGIMPVDGHVHRVARRLGWAPMDASPRTVQRGIEAAAPGADLMDLHVNLIRLGHNECKPGMPDCWNCPVSQFCATALRQPGIETGLSTP